MGTCKVVECALWHHPHRAAQSVRRLRYAEIAAAVHVVSDAPCVMDMYMFRSYADYAWSYLSKTAAKATEVKLFGPQVGISA